MQNQNLGKLEPVDPRKVWKNEAADFTPWLAHEDNIKLLGDTLFLDLELVSQERSIGPYRADIVCRDTTFLIKGKTFGFFLCLKTFGNFIS